MKRSSAALAALGAFLGLGWITGGCTLAYGDLTPDCPNFERGHVDANGQPDECHYNDPKCPGDCMKRPELGWFGPAAIWIGSTDEPAPECPEGTSQPSAIGFADLVAPAVCPACTCGSPSGSCESPASIAARAATCATPGGWTTSFDAPASWDGSCTSVNAIPQGKTCGGAPCVQSLNIAPLTVVESGCPAMSGPPAQPVGPIYWKTHAQACVGPVRNDLCGADELVCFASVKPPPPGYRQCVYQPGDLPCPSGYPERHVFYKDFENHVTCTPCKCGPPVGSLCTGTLSIYEDGACSVPIKNSSIASVMSICEDMAIPGTALGSKSLSNLTYQPGSCQASGGEPIGTVDLTEPATVCCIGQD